MASMTRSNTTSTIQFRSLNLTNEARRAEFEHFFYLAFNQRKNQDLIRQIWSWDDDKQRISLKEPLDKVSVHAFYDEQEQAQLYIAGAESPTFSQYTHFGFKTPDNTGRLLEIYTLFSTPDTNRGLAYMNKSGLQGHSLPHLKKEGFDTLLATCNDRLLGLYLRWGWQRLDSKSFDGGVNRHFIKYSLS